MTCAENLQETIEQNPGTTDGVLAATLGKSHQHINGEARHLANLKKIVRFKGDDGVIRNYPYRPLNSPVRVLRG